MAIMKTLAQRFRNLTKMSSQSLSSCRISSSSVQSRFSPATPDGNISPETGDISAAFRRLVHKTSSSSQSELRSIPTATAGLLRQLREMDVSRNRIRLDGLVPPETPASTEVTVEDARKLLRAAQLESVKSKLRSIPQNCASYSEFVRICEENCPDRDQAEKVAKMLDDSASVIVFGEIVFLRPEQVAKTIQTLLSVTVPGSNAQDSARKDLEKMEKEKEAIDSRAEKLVRRELWGGLGFLVVQTAALMRLTFWELTWDVMEPICFYVTSMYFMAGYAFFLRTSKEPSFEGFYQSRFSSKQKRLMKLRNFDVARYNELRGSSIGYPLKKFHKNL